MYRRIWAIGLLWPASTLAHHGVAGLGAAGLTGPGAPIESPSAATLPAGRWLAYLKLDHVEYERFDPDPANPEADYSQFWIAGAGYGFTPWLSAYAFLPYNVKVDEPHGFDTRGVADLALVATFGFKYDEGLHLTPANESLDDLEDWHFTLYGGLTLPTGDPNLRDHDGHIDPSKSTGFGEPAYTLGGTATKWLGGRTTLNFDASYQGFQEHTYDDGTRFRFGDETRFNAALIRRLHTRPERKLRVDLSVEGQYLRLGRDEAFGKGVPATGGEIVYALPGVRLFWDKLSMGLGVKWPVWTDLNEEDQQQGAEGKEDYRLIATISVLF
jgi:hypothetical protein